MRKVEDSRLRQQRRPFQHCSPLKTPAHPSYSLASFEGMYAAIRPALRSAFVANPQSRNFHNRYPSTFRLRFFHATRCLAQTPTPSSSTPADENGTEKGEREKAETAAEGIDAGAGLEDPEIIAQKLQRSREMTRRYTSALRRTQRGKRAMDLPPIHIPDWFLKGRVKLREEVETEDLDGKTQDQGKDTEIFMSVTITHKESGEHATVSIPFWSYFRGSVNMSRITRAMWRSGMTDEQRKEFALDFAKRIGVENNEISVKALKDGQDVFPEVVQKSVPMEEPTKELSATSSEEGDRHYTENNQQVSNGKETRAENFAKEQNRSGRRISPLVLAEIRATIAASLHTVHSATNESFPASRTNLILHSPSNAHERVLVHNLVSIASGVEADVVTLHPQDLAQLMGDYIGEGPEPSPHSIRSLGYDTYKFGSDFASEMEELGSEDPAEEEQDANSDLPMDPNSAPNSARRPMSKTPMSIIAISPMLASLKAVRDALSSGASQGENNVGSASNQQPRVQTQNELQLEDLKISTLLEALIDSNELKRSRGLVGAESNSKRARRWVKKDKNIGTTTELFNYSVAKDAEFDLSSALPHEAASDFKFTINVQPLSRRPSAPQKSTIIHIADIKELNATQYGSRILQKLEEIVRKRRSTGESIMIVGTTCSLDLVPELSSAGIQSLQSEGDSGLFRTIAVPIAPLEKASAVWAADDLEYDAMSFKRQMLLEQTTTIPEKRKFQRINLWHIHDMLRRLDPEATVKMTVEGYDLETYRPFHPMFPRHNLHRVLTYDEVHRISLTALGLHLTDPSSTNLSWAHVALSMGLLKASDEVKFVQVLKPGIKADVPWEYVAARKSGPRVPGHSAGRPRLSPEKHLEIEKAAKRRHDLHRVALSATKHEKRLMPGIADPDSIKTTFDQVHVPKDTLEAIRTLTSLSLIRPDAFNYGVLANEKISGALLYGPPGTGKTLLAKAVAKESGSMVLEVSGSSIMDKYVGEGEKNVSAIFSLARKLSPCIVFLDEADAIFASRNSGRERTSHRDILNQFLKEWDGLNDLSVFVMVATNRPFDLDDAVIRRLPRRLLVDLPTQEDRKEILKIHLRGEQLDESVDLDDLAKRTPLYSGSDLKNVAVSAALACVKEENENAAIAAAKEASEAAENEADDVIAKSDKMKATTEDAAIAKVISHFSDDFGTPLQPEAFNKALLDTSTLASSITPPPTTAAAPPTSLPDTLSTLKSLNPPRLVHGQKYNFPEKRILHARHFDKALLEISASISEDMSSLNAVKKFDEQYGDRKGRRKKNAYGFGIHSDKDSEGSARVRA
jgi:SpoVK/Ycf46/Vps4 family AAA+-type ATPase